MTRFPPPKEGQAPKVLTQDVTLLGARHGRGEVIYSNGDTYAGEFVDGQREGYGKYTDPSGAVAYQGEWKDGQPANL